MTEHNGAESSRQELLTADGFSSLAAGFFELQLDSDLQELPGLLNGTPGKPTRVLVTLSAHGDGRAFSLPAMLQHRNDLTFYATGDLIPEQATYLLSCGYEGLALGHEHLDGYGREHWLAALQSRLQYSSQCQRSSA